MKRIALFLGTVWVAQAAAAMEVGTNFWNLGWHRPDDCFADFRNVSGGNPWNPQFLKEISIYRTLRFMDWNGTNNSERASWIQRPTKDVPKQNPVAYEWMIDLSNRMDANMWVTIPHRTISREMANEPCDYALRLCLLVKTGVDLQQADLRPPIDQLSTLSADDLIAAGGIRRCEPLKPDLKLYVEYSNETWNGQFKQAHYCADEGTALSLAKERWTAGFRFHAWAAIRLFRAADLVFGADSARVVKVLATQSGNAWIAGRHQDVMADSKRNPWGVKAGAVAIAPYFGNGVDGAEPDAIERLRTAIQKSAEQAAKHRQIADAAGLQLIAYEGGQHVIVNAKAINRSPAMGELYGTYLREMSRHLAQFCHYAHVGQAGDRGAWGAIEHTGQPIAEAAKYRALVEWAKRGAAK